MLFSHTIWPTPGNPRGAQAPRATGTEEKELRRGPRTRDRATQSSAGCQQGISRASLYGSKQFIKSTLLNKGAANGSSIASKSIYRPRWTLLGHQGHGQRWVGPFLPPKYFLTRPGKAKLTNSPNRLQIYFNKVGSQSLSFGATLKARLYCNSLWFIEGHAHDPPSRAKIGHPSPKKKCVLGNLIG